MLRRSSRDLPQAQLQTRFHAGLRLRASDARRYARGASLFQVQVKDAVTGASICDPLVVASVGTEHTQLRCYSHPDCVCSGVDERLGTFELTVNKAGYRTATTTAVVDQTNGCHVVPKFTVIRLRPLRSKRHPP
jgi:hypothetical protein